MITIIHAAHTVYCRNVFYAGYPMEKGKKTTTLLLILISGFEHVSAGSAMNLKWKFYSCTAFTCI